MEDRNLNRRFVASLAKPVPLYNIPCSVDEARLELSMESSRNQNSALVCSPTSSSQNHPWDCQYGLGRRDSQRVFEDDQILMRAREDFVKQSMKRSTSICAGKIPDGVSVNARLSKEIISGERQSNSASNKGKGVTREHQEALDQNSTADVNPRPMSDEGVSGEVLGSSEVPKSGGISLREWLSSESIKVNKAEKLLIFGHIVQLVDFAHSQGSSLQDLRPSRFVVLPSNKIKYMGSLAMRESRSVVIQDPNRKRPLNQIPLENYMNGVKRPKLSEGSRISGCIRNPGYENTLTGQLEKEWYTSPEAIETCPSNIYGLGVLLFELLCSFESLEAHLALMSDLQRRVLPGKFLSENPIESAFCLRLLHPDVLSRPTTREILQSELLRGSQDSVSADDDVDPQSELLLSFFSSLKEAKESRATKLLEEIGCLDEDIKGVERKYSLRADSVFSTSHSDEIPGTSSFLGSRKDDGRLMKNMRQLENAYFCMRSRIGRATRIASMTQSHKDSQRNHNKTSDELIEAFFDGVCKFSRYSQFKVCGALRNGDVYKSTNAICALSFDRDEEYIATAKVSKKIKIFEYDALLDEAAADIHYPVVEMSNKSMLSSISWNYYIKNYLASADYDGMVKMWDASTGKSFVQFTEHKKRAWSIDFSRADPVMFASGSDDCSVRLWSVNDKISIGTICSPANVCCVQFSENSSHQLVFGSADYKIYGYDLRHIRVPLYTLAGHKKAVSYVKFVDSETLVSASTDNTLKLWDLKKNAPTGVSTDSCSLTFTGHANEKNFVGLSVLDGYIVCGSETNEVYSYYRSLPMPITSHKFKTVDPVSGEEISDDNNGQFVSSVCWRRKSNTVVAANSSGVLKLLQMV